MATCNTISISANPDPSDEFSQASEVITFQSPSSPRGAPTQTLNGVKISRKPETLDSLMTHLSSCGINLLRIIYIKETFTQDRVVFLSCVSIHGDSLIVLPPDNFTLQSGDLEVVNERPETKFVPDGVSKFFLQKVSNPLNVGFTFVCNAGLQYFPTGKEESVSYGYKDYADAQMFLKLKKHYYTVVPTVEFARLVKVERLNTLQIALENLSSTPNQYTDFANVVLESPFMPLMSSEVELTLLVPPTISLDLDVASHILVGRHDLIKENSGDFTVKTFNQAGSQVELIYENDRLQGFKIGEELVKVDLEKPAISKYNGLIFGIESPLPTLEDEQRERTYMIPSTSDITDIFTVFDLSKQSLLIDVVRQKIDIEEQNELLKSVNNFNNITEEVIVKSHRDMKELFKVYTSKMSKLQELFYQKEVPCLEPVCEDYDQLQKEVEKANKKFKKRVEASGKLRFLLKEVEILMLELFDIQRELEVEKPIRKIQNPDY